MLAHSAEGSSFSPSVVERRRMHKETFTLAIQVRLGAGLLGNAGGFLASNQLSTPLGVLIRERITYRCCRNDCHRDNVLLGRYTITSATAVIGHYLTFLSRARGSWKMYAYPSMDSHVGQAMYVMRKPMVLRVCNVSTKLMHGTTVIATSSSTLCLSCISAPSRPSSTATGKHRGRTSRNCWVT